MFNFVHLYIYIYIFLTRFYLDSNLPLSHSNINRNIVDKVAPLAKRIPGINVMCDKLTAIGSIIVSNWTSRNSGEAWLFSNRYSLILVELWNRVLNLNPLATNRKQQRNVTKIPQQLYFNWSDFCKDRLQELKTNHHKLFTSVLNHARWRWVNSMNSLTLVNKCI